jgi:hypothetical protein
MRWWARCRERAVVGGGGGVVEGATGGDAVMRCDAMEGGGAVEEVERVPVVGRRWRGGRAARRRALHQHQSVWVHRGRCIEGEVEGAQMCIREASSGAAASPQPRGAGRMVESTRAR